MYMQYQALFTEASWNRKIKLSHKYTIILLNKGNSYEIIVKTRSRLSKIGTQAAHLWNNSKYNAKRLLS